MSAFGVAEEDCSGVISGWMQAATKQQKVHLYWTTTELVLAKSNTGLFGGIRSISDIYHCHGNTSPKGAIKCPTRLKISLQDVLRSTAKTSSHWTGLSRVQQTRHSWDTTKPWTEQNPQSTVTVRELRLIHVYQDLFIYSELCQVRETQTGVVREENVTLIIRDKKLVEYWSGCWNPMFS